MERRVFISYLKNDSNEYVEELRSALGRQHIHVANDVSDPRINVALFVLSYPYLWDEHAIKEAEMLLKRGDVWCIPLYQGGITTVHVQSMTRTPQAKPVWEVLNKLATPGSDVELVVERIRKGPFQEKVYDAFISHSGEVKPFCKKLKSELDNRGLSVFLDVDAIRGGEGPMPFSTEIQNGIAKSKIVVVILSHHFESKFWTTEEIRLSRENGVKVLPVYYHISREMCLGRLDVASGLERENLNWLFQQPGIEHYGHYAGKQLTEDQLIHSIVERVCRQLG